MLLSLKAEISIEFGDLKPMVAWLERNCAGEWGYDCVQPAGNTVGTYQFYFENEKDLVAFRMWKQ
jgi:hypothetical protein